MCKTLTTTNLATHTIRLTNLHRSSQKSHTRQWLAGTDPIPRYKILENLEHIRAMGRRARSRSGGWSSRGSPAFSTEGEAFLARSGASVRESVEVLQVKEGVEVESEAAAPLYAGDEVEVWHGKSGGDDYGREAGLRE